ncbi:Nudix family hydrolase [Pelomicrobium sp. G1]|uniref:Nudix family hydrolase n=1 Tax=unclassified Pelomicrobium TaxID=2815318 RepID=UPI003F7703F7
MSAAARLPVIDVAVAVVQRSDGRVLLAERPRGKVSAGYWELPGGKFDAGERAEQALARELREELGVELDAAYPWLTYEHAYPDKRVRLHFFRVLGWHGTPHGREGQRISWEDPQAPSVGPLLPANEKLLKALRLPPVYAITNAGKYGVAEFMARLEQALEGGLRLIQVRETGIAPEQLAQFARRVVTVARRYGARVLVNGDETLARKVGADGVHLQADRLMRLSVPPGTRLWAASCHDARQLARAAALGADFVTLSPVLPTATHPEEPGLGWTKFTRLVHGYPLPVYALGGMRLELLETAMRHGAHGIALLSGIWDRVGAPRAEVRDS